MLTPSSLAKDVMQTELVTISSSDSLREAMELMVENHISGLPVVDGRNRCIGIVTVTDILGLEYEQAETATDSEQVGSYYDPDGQRWQTMRFAGGIDELPDLTAREVMSTDAVSVAPDATLRDVAEIMCERHVHRVLVLDDERTLYGLIGALDLVRVVADS